MIAAILLFGFAAADPGGWTVAKWGMTPDQILAAPGTATPARSSNPSGPSPPPSSSSAASSSGASLSGPFGSPMSAATDPLQSTKPRYVLFQNF